VSAPQLPHRPGDLADSLARLYPSRPYLGVSIAVFRQGRVLVATRTKPPYAGMFTLPGGLVETGETLAEAALRELNEEVGVEARIVAFNQHIELIERDDEDRIRRHHVIASFAAEWISGEGQAGPEAGEVLWARIEDLAEVPCSPHLLPVVEAAAEILARKAPECMGVINRDRQGFK
jgi:8-oxo-dGTP diphosphatase